MKHIHKFLTALVILSFMLGSLPTQPALAVGTWVVTKNSDSNDGACNSDCSLREAVAAANPGDTITFASSLAGKTIMLTNYIDLKKNLSIDGSNLGLNVSVSGGDYGGLFVIGNGYTVSINHLDFIDSVYSGAIWNDQGSLTISNCKFSGNHIMDGAPESGGGAIDNHYGTLTVINSTFSGNSAYQQGGALFNYGGTINVSNSSFYGNSALNGGAILNSYGTVIITSSTFTGNSANAGGGISSHSGTLMVTSSIFSNNSASEGGGIRNFGIGMVSNNLFQSNDASRDGGGIYNGNAPLAKGILSVKNSTFSGNKASDSGGGIYNDYVSTVINDTFTSNVAGFGGSLYNTENGSLDLENTILANSTSTYDCLNHGDIPIEGHNLIETNGPAGSACGTPLLAMDPKLGPLANNGGPTLTHALLIGSPAIDYGDNSLCTSAPGALDQRGKPRSVDGDKNGSAICDIGAFEFQGTPGKLSQRSQAKYDGWILEKSEKSNKGGSLNSRSKVFFVGDDDLNRQYRGILSFDTSSIPDWAVVTNVTLKVKKAGLVGTNPFKSHKGLRVDIRNPYFGTKAGLQTSDFQTKGSKNLAGKFSSKAVSKWYSADLSAASIYVNKTGLTQFRLRFYRDDNNDGGADYFKFYSGNAPIVSRPQLIVEYYLP